MVDWSLARQIARLAAGSGGGPQPEVDLVGLGAEMEPHVRRYTRLGLHRPVPEAELVSRAEWAALNLDGFARLLDPVAARLDRRLDFAGPFAGALRIAAGATLAAEVGLVIGYVSQRVLGQYELSLLQPEAPPRLVFVGPNLERAVRDLGVDRDSFLGWIVIHELTHVFQFESVPWLREHLGGILRDYLRTVEVRIERGAAGGLPSLPHPSRLVEAFRDGGLVALVQTREQRALMERMQAVMALVEGYSEHVMDVLGARLLPAYAGLRVAMDRRRRTRSAPERVIERLLGLELKLRQYELGKRFCDLVAERWGIEGLNLVWRAPEALPTLNELSRPDAWLDRVAAGTGAAALAAR
jgi:coenzyme F420 biosynthesis associated uncharacterized protein